MSDAISDLRDFESGVVKQKQCSCALTFDAMQCDIKVLRLEITRLRNTLFTLSPTLSKFNEANNKIDAVYDLLDRVYNDFLSKQPEEVVLGKEEVQQQSKTDEIGF